MPSSLGVCHLCEPTWSARTSHSGGEGSGQCLRALRSRADCTGALSATDPETWAAGHDRAPESVLSSDSACVGVSLASHECTSSCGQVAMHPPITPHTGSPAQQTRRCRGTTPTQCCKMRPSLRSNACGELAPNSPHTHTHLCPGPKASECCCTAGMRGASV